MEQELTLMQQVKAIIEIDPVTFGILTGFALVALGLVLYVAYLAGCALARAVSITPSHRRYR